MLASEVAVNQEERVELVTRLLALMTGELGDAAGETVEDQGKDLDSDEQIAHLRVICR